MADRLSEAFVSYTSEILADTTLGFSGPQIVKITAGYSVEWGVPIPHQAYPFHKSVPNKRTALYQNLMAFPEPQRYQIIREAVRSSDRSRQANGQAAEKLKLRLITRYGHLADESLGSELDTVLIQRTQHWLAPFSDVLALYDQGVQKHANGIFLRNVLDDLRLALELLLKLIFGNEKSLENQIPLLGDFIKKRGGSPELVTCLSSLLITTLTEIPI